MRSAVLLLLLSVSRLTCAAQYAGVSTAHPTGSPSISADGLAAAFDMETVTEDGRLRDFSGNGNHGTFTRAEIVQGMFGKARRFSSVADRVNLASQASLDIEGPLSIATWVRVRQTGLHQHIVACDNRFALWFTPDDQLRFVDTLASGLMTKWQVLKDEWHSLIGVFHGTAGDAVTQANIRVYVDGQAVDGYIVGPRVWGKGPLFPRDACSIGFESHQGIENHRGLLFSGDIDELLIFHRALDEREVAAFARR